MSQQGELIPAAGVSRGRLSEIAKLRTQDAVSQGLHPKRDEELFTCQSCKKQVPSQRHFDLLDEIERQNAPGQRDDTWRI